MNHRQPVFFVSNTERREEFLIETRIRQKANGSLYVEKKALTENAQTHLKRMIHSYQTLINEKKLSNLINIVAPTKSSMKTLEFDFIEGISAERLLLEKVLIEDKQAVYTIIDRLFSLISFLPSTLVNPTNSPSYVEVFGKTFGSVQDCTKLGIIDLNLDNIIIEKNSKWYLYDYEWVFDFPVPKRLLKARFMWYFVVRHKELLKYHSARIDSVCTMKDLYIPRFLYEQYEEIFKDFSNLALAEQAFQVYVTDKTGSILSSINESTFLVSDAKAPKVGIEAFLKKFVDAETDKIRKELGIEHALRTSAEIKLETIISSKSYRVAEKISKVKSKILRKQ